MEVVRLVVEEYKKELEYVRFEVECFVCECLEVECKVDEER